MINNNKIAIENYIVEESYNIASIFDKKLFKIKNNENLIRAIDVTSILKLKIEKLMNNIIDLFNFNKIPAFNNKTYNSKLKQNIKKFLKNQYAAIINDGVQFLNKLK